VWSVLVMLAGTGCGRTQANGGDDTCALGPQLYPLAVGNRWTYRDTNGKRFDYRVVARDGSEGWWLEQRNDDGKRYGDFVRGGPDELAMLRSDITGAGAPSWLVFPATPGRRWSDRYYSNQSYCIDNSDIGTEPETVEVPAGSFQATVVSRGTDCGAATFLGKRWFVAGVGLVRETWSMLSEGKVTNWGDNQLVSYQVEGGGCGARVL
jgi:hypothetical protein